MAMFKRLCGPDPLKNVVVVTTFWDKVDLTQGLANESELKTKNKFFKGLFDGKCRFSRSGKYPPGKTPKGPEFPPPISIVSDLLAPNPVFVNMQKELTDLNQKIAEMKSINVRDRVVREALEDERRLLKAQLEDLVTSRSELVSAIAQLKREKEALAKVGV